MKPTTLFLILLALQLSACVTPPDVPSCRALNAKTETKQVEGIGLVTIERPNPVCMKEIGESTCGFCQWSITDKHQYVGEAEKTKLNKKPWSKVKAEAVLIPPESYAKVKEFVINICKKSNDCNQDISRWRLKLDSLDSGAAGF